MTLFSEPIWTNVSDMSDISSLSIKYDLICQIFVYKFLTNDPAKIDLAGRMDLAHFWYGARSFLLWTEVIFAPALLWN